MGNGVPTDQLSHNHCDCTDSHCNSHIVLRVCLCFFLSHHLSQVRRRQKQLSDFVETKKYWTLPKSCSSQSSEWEERKKSRGKRGSLCARRRSRKTVTCHGLRVVEPVYHQASLRGRWRNWRRNGRRAGLGQARFVISQDSHTDFVLFVFYPCEQAIVAAPGRRLWRRRESNAAGAHVLFNLMCCLFTSLRGSLVLRFVLRSLFPILRVSFVFQLNTCYNTHGHVSVFSKAPPVCLVHSYRCGYVVF